MRILVIDSDKEILDLVRNTLAADHEVYVFRTLGEVDVETQFDVALANFFNPLCSFENIEDFCEDREILLVAISADSVAQHDRQLNMPFDSPDLWRVLDLISQGRDHFVVDTIETKFLKGYHKYRVN